MSISYGQIWDVLRRLETWLEQEGYKGWDPHDGLNSSLLRALTLGNRYLGIIVVQLFKRFPVNLRPIFGVRKEFNPKGMGLFLSAYIRKYRLTKDDKDLQKARSFARWLEQNSSHSYSGYCWGYNFDWPNRAFYARKGIPTVVNTSFIANAFLDAYELLGEERYLNIARSSCEFVIRDLNLFAEDNALCFSYTPVDNSRIHNANMLGAALLARVYSITKEPLLREYSDRAVEFTIKHQNKDGSWYYGETPNQRWIDLFHTGYVLGALEDYMRFTGNWDYEDNLQKGFSFFIDRFFENGIPKYYHDRVYPIDIHCLAQAILTLLKFRRLNKDSVQLAEKVALWTIENMWDENGYFYYQKNRHYTIKIPYMRWTQAWMFYALTTLLANENERQKD